MASIGIDLNQHGWPAAVWRDGRVEVIPTSPLTAAAGSGMPVDGIIRARKSDAERYLGRAVTGAVIAVPAISKAPLHDGIRAAVRKAGLEAVRLIHCAGAACLDYHWKNPKDEGMYLCVYAGGAFCDAALVEIGGGVAEMWAVTGTDKVNAGMLRGMPPAEAEKLLRPLVRETREIAYWQDEQTPGGPLRGFIPAGDAGAMDVLVEALRRITGLQPVAGPGQDDAAVRGAAVQAGVLSGEVEDLLFLDATVHSLQLLEAGGKCVRLIERGTTIPTYKTKAFSTSSDGQTSMEVRLFQGESEQPGENTELGTYTVGGITPLPKGKAQVELSVFIDADGLTVSAVEPDGKKGRPLPVTRKGEKSPPPKPAPGPQKSAPKPRPAPEPKKSAPKPRPASEPEKRQPPPQAGGDGRIEAVLKLLPVFDSLTRAIQCETDEDKRRGSEAILKQYRTILSDMGVQRIETVGRTFDPHLHDAQGHIVDPRYGPGEIVRELEAGFTVDGRVIRYAKVQVAN